MTTQVPDDKLLASVVSSKTLSSNKAKSFSSWRRLNYLLDILSIAAIDFCPSLVAWQNFLKCASTGHSVVKVLGSEPGLSFVFNV